MLAGQLELQLIADVAKLKTDMDKMTGIVEKNSKQMEAAFGKVGNAIKGLAAGLTVAAFNSWIKSAIDAADASSKMAQKTGIATKDLAGLQLAYRQAGVDGSQFERSMVKLSEAVVKGNIGLEALGIKTKSSSGAFKEVKQVLAEVADKFQGMENGAQKNALATEIFGQRIGSQMIPLLNSGSEGLREMAEMAEKLGLVIGEETGKQAEKFNDTMDLLGQGVQGVARGVAAQLLPTLTTLAGEFLASMTEGEKLKNTATALAAGFKSLYSAGVIVAQIFGTVGKVLGGVAAAIVAAMSGEWKQALDILGEAQKDIHKGWADSAKSIGRVWTEEGNTVIENTAKMRKGERDLMAEAEGRRTAQKKGASDAEKALQKEAEEYRKLMETIDERVSMQQMEIDKGRELTEAEKFEVKILNDMKNAKVALTAEHRKAIEVALAGAKAIDLRVESRKEELKAIVALNKFHVDTDQELAAADRQRTDTRNQFAADLRNQAEALEDSNKELKLEASLLGATNREAAIAKAELQAEIVLQRELEKINRETWLVEESRAALRKDAFDNRDASVALAREKEDLREQSDLLRTMDGIGRDLWFNFWEDGSSAFKKLTQLLKTTLLDTLYKMTLQKWIINIVASLTGGGGVAGAAAGGVAQAAGSSIFGGGGSILSSGVGNLFGGALGQGLGATMQNGIFGGIGANFANIGTALGGGQLGFAAGAALPYIGLGLAVLSMVGAFKKGETRVGGQYDLTTLVGAPSGGPIEDQTVRASISSTIDTINQTLRALGSSSQVSGFHSGLEQSTKGMGFAYARGVLTTGGNFGDWSMPGYMQNRGTMTAQEALAAYTTELKQATLSALQAAIDLPKSISMMLEGVDINALGDADLQAILERISELATAVEGFRQVVALLPFESLRDRSFDSAAGLIKLAGGLDQLTAGLNAYYENFFNEEEKRINTANAISRRLAEGGLIFSGDDILRITQMANARQIFRDYTDAFMAMGEGGDTAVAALLAVAGAFAQLTPAAEEVTGAILDLASLQRDVDEAYMRVFEMRKDELTTLKETARRYTELANGLRSFRDSLLVGDLSPLTPAQKYAQTSSLFQSTYSAALGGDTEAQTRLQAVSRDFLVASRDFFASSEQYQSDFARVQSALTISIAKAAEEAAWAAEQAGILEEQLTALGIINSSVQTVSQAIQELARAISAVIAAGGNPGAGPIGTLTGGVTGQFVETPIGPVYSSTAGAAATGGKIYTVNGGVYTQAEAQSIINEMISQGRTREAYDAFKAAGVTLAEANIIMGWPSRTAEDWARAVGLPVFHTGTDYVPRTGLAMLEQGERVVPRSLNDGMARDPREVRRLLESLVNEVQQLRSEHRTGVNARNETTMAAAERTGEIVVQGTASYRSRASFEADNERRARTAA